MAPSSAWTVPEICEGLAARPYEWPGVLARLESLSTSRLRSELSATHARTLLRVNAEAFGSLPWCWWTLPQEDIHLWTGLRVADGRWGHGQGLPIDPSVFSREWEHTSLELLVAAEQAGAPVLLVGEGKSTLLGPDCLALYMDGEMDWKALIGLHVCTETPGEFRWQAGVLTQALREGRRVLLEGLEAAPFDVLAAMVPLLEKNSLTIQGSVEHAAPGFHVYATLGSGALLSPETQCFVDQYFTRVQVPPLDLSGIITSCYPGVLSVLDKMLDTHERVARACPTASTARALFKWCARVTQFAPCIDGAYLTADTRECVALHAYRCYFAGLVSPGTRQALYTECIASVWEPPCASGSPPRITETPSLLRVGHVDLPKLGAPVAGHRQFCYTAHATTLMESLAECVARVEPVLLISETGTGKTSVVQHLADRLGQTLVVQNLNQQTDSSEFLGGFKPVDLRSGALPLMNTFASLFPDTFSSKSNQEFLGRLRDAFDTKHWSLMVALLRKTCDAALASSSPKRRRRVDPTVLRGHWQDFSVALDTFAGQLGAFVFGFQEGSLVRALRHGHWILLDEVNLASAEALQRLTQVLETADASVTLVEKGEAVAVPRHPDFRVFACMNPSTDFAKKDLPRALQARFTALFVDESLDPVDLALLVADLLRGCTASPPVPAVVDLYLEARALASTTLLDGADQRPHYSLRSLCRALHFCRDNVAALGFTRALYEGLLVSFVSPLVGSSRALVTALIVDKVLGGVALPTHQRPKCPGAGYTEVQGFWIARGAEPDAPTQEEFVVTPSVALRLQDLARVIAGARGRYPVLLQGPTSSGKTSLVQHIARVTGHKCVRINNHEHTDLQEYMGCYVSAADGTLQFQEGLLVEAVRRGHWIVLDELNLAPSEVLEALNRLLDDHRELVVPETQEVIRPHPQFMLFGTQNPPGVYGGRKVLSRAFRNRFVEMHVDDLPPGELAAILEQRCAVPPSYARRMVEVMQELQRRRQHTQIFAGKKGFLTPRDLFKWGARAPASLQQLAEHGFMVLGERLRSAHEKALVREVLSRVCKHELEPAAMYGAAVPRAADLEQHFGGLAWTLGLRRMVALVRACIAHGEPVLLVGDTGSGKTLAAQIVAFLRGQRLHIVNCHQHTETADLLGSLRPVRGKAHLRDQLRATPADAPEAAEALRARLAVLFEWVDGPVVTAMKAGDLVLIDEISLAEDAVLERLNSVLEASRALVLAEKGGLHADLLVRAAPEFAVIATMNPAGDFGKKELSPALRNRFTEVWVPTITCHQDLVQIVTESFRDPDVARVLAAPMIEFAEAYAEGTGGRARLSLRDLRAWILFIERVAHLEVLARYAHGAELVVLDGLGLGTGHGAHPELRARLGALVRRQTAGVCTAPHALVVSDTHVAMGPFRVPRQAPAADLALGYALDAPTTSANLWRVLRGLQLPKAVLLEGAPGVGKTSLVVALARAAGRPVTRINLSEQTDMMDLLGSDLPVPGGAPGEFRWCDGVFLAAVRAGHWVLLDELNLASQSVLEGLNAVLDHRAEVFIPELSRTVACAPGFRVFACQNPVAMGGGRKALPQSFLNRFSKVYLAELLADDLLFIARTRFPRIAADVLARMVEFTRRMHAALHDAEYNLRDLCRWAELMEAGWDAAVYGAGPDVVMRPEDHVGLLYLHRLRTEADRSTAVDLYREVFGVALDLGRRPEHNTDTPPVLSVGLATASDALYPVNILEADLTAAEAVLTCVAREWPALLVGRRGKHLVHRLGAALGRHVLTVSVTGSMDAVELLGGWTQAEDDDHEAWAQYLHRVRVGQDTDLQSYAAARASDDADTRHAACRQAGVAVRTGGKGRFHWVDGVLLRGMLTGCWVVLDNVNFCSASVLDRLNGLLEGGSEGILLNECGTLRRVTPHPDFRLFLTMQARFGELSRAMRNRCVEVFEVESLTRADRIRSLNDLGVLGVALPSAMLDVQAEVDPSVDEARLLLWGRLAGEQLRRGLDPTSALVCTLGYCYEVSADHLQGVGRVLDAARAQGVEYPLTGNGSLVAAVQATAELYPGDRDVAVYTVSSATGADFALPVPSGDAMWNAVTLRALSELHPEALARLPGWRLDLHTRIAVFHTPTPLVLFTALDTWLATLVRDAPRDAVEAVFALREAALRDWDDAHRLPVRLAALTKLCKRLGATQQLSLVLAALVKQHNADSRGKNRLYKYGGGAPAALTGLEDTPAVGGAARRDVMEAIATLWASSSEELRAAVDKALALHAQAGPATPGPMGALTRGKYYVENSTDEFLVRMRDDYVSGACSDEVRVVAEQVFTAMGLGMDTPSQELVDMAVSYTLLPCAEMALWQSWVWGVRDIHVLEGCWGTLLALYTGRDPSGTITDTVLAVLGKRAAVSIGERRTLQTSITDLSSVLTVYPDTPPTPEWMALWWRSLEGLAAAFTKSCASLPEARDIAQYLEVLGASSDARLSAGVAAVSVSMASAVSANNAAQAWILLGVLKFHLLIPGQAFDPSLKHTMVAQDCHALIAELEHTRAMRVHIEQWYRGASDCAEVTRLDTRIAELTAAAASASAKVLARPAHARGFAELHSECHGFARAVLAFHRLPGWDTQAVREGVARSLDEFASRLSLRFPGYRDWTGPLTRVLHEIKLGVWLGKATTRSSSALLRADLPLHSMLKQSTDTQSNVVFLVGLWKVAGPSDRRGLEVLLGDATRAAAVHWWQRHCARLEEQELATSAYSYTEENVDQLVGQYFVDRSTDDDDDSEEKEEEQPAVKGVVAPKILWEACQQVFVLKRSEDAEEWRWRLWELVTARPSGTGTELRSAGLRGLLRREHVRLQHDEVALLEQPLYLLLSRLEHLLVEFPEHPLLTQLVGIVTKLLRTPVASPVTAIIGSLHTLLTKAQQWEINAAKHVSLRDPHLNSMALLIARYRKQQLRQISSLLSTRRAQHQDKSIGHWLHVLQLLASAAPDAAVQLSDDFLRAASAGEFHTRLDMIYCAGRLLAQGTAVARAVSGVWAYYAQFGARVTAWLDSQTAAVEKRLGDVVRLGQWDVSNVYALEVSSRKVQSSLVRLVRDLDEVLHTPFSGVVTGSVPVTSIPVSPGRLGTVSAELVERVAAVRPLSITVKKRALSDWFKQLKTMIGSQGGRVHYTKVEVLSLGVFPVALDTHQAAFFRCMYAVHNLGITEPQTEDLTSTEVDRLRGICSSLFALLVDQRAWLLSRVGVPAVHTAAVSCSAMERAMALETGESVPLDDSKDLGRLVPYAYEKQWCGDGWLGSEWRALDTVDGVLAQHLAVAGLLEFGVALAAELLAKGFCRPQDEEEGEQGEDQAGDGTGMDTGQGSKDVSNEIEDEEQLLGLKGEKPPEEPEDPTPEEDQGLEMENEFDGDTHDKEQGSDQDDEDPEGVEEEMGDLADGPQDVQDEKMDEDSDQDEDPQDQPKDSDEKMEDDGGVAGGQDDLDLMPKQEDGKDGPEQDNDQGPDQDQEVDEDQPSELPEVEEDQFHDPDTKGAGVDEDEGTDEMSVDEDQAELDDDDADDDDDLMEQDGDGQEEDHSMEEDAQDSGEDDPEGMDVDTAAAADDDQAEDATAEDMEEVMDKAHRGGTGAEDQEYEQTGGGEEQTEEAASGGGGGGDGREDAADGEMVGSKPGAGDPSSSSKEQPRRNPLRSLGDATEYWKDKVEVLEAKAMEDAAGDDDAEAGSVARHVGDDADASGQALATADESHDQQVMRHPEDDDEDLSQDEDELQEDEMELPQQSAASGSTTKDVVTPEEEEQVVDQEVIDLVDSDVEVLDVESFIGASNTTAMDLEEDPDHDLDTVLTASRELRAALDGDADAWRALLHRTEPLAMELCEQLRVVLEPLEATKLEGDYRSGKRLSMKRIIAYIASDFRKDKIWLRRSRPSKRSYQVVVALDNSKSMRELGASAAALDTLAMLCQALPKLEISDLAVVSFGDDVRVLHEFNQGLTADQGAAMLAHLQFSEASTQWAAMLAAVLGLLNRHRSSAPLQLAFIVSDARFHEDRARLSRLARAAALKGQLLVLIIVDSEDSRHSIVNLQSVRYEDKRVEMVRYLDEFPFAYYVVLRDTAALPGIIADALRQWFELIRSSGL